MNIRQYLAHPLVVNIRAVAGELSVGLGYAWILLVLIELMRRGSVSLYINLHVILLGAVITWLVGTKAESMRRWEKYAFLGIFAILLAVVAWRMATRVLVGR